MTRLKARRRRVILKAVSLPSFDILIYMRLQGKRFLLTYPQCPLEKHVLLAHLRSYGVEKAIVCREKHTDGNTHLHGVVELKRKIDQSRGETFFDIGEYHGNYQATRSWKNCVEYVRKDGDIIWYPDNLSIEDIAKGGKETDLPECGTFDSETDWLYECLRKHIPFGFAKRLWELSRKDHGNTVTEVPNWMICAELEQQTVGEMDYSVVVIGRTGLGKTSWGLKHIPKPALLVTHMDDLRKYDMNYHRGIVFDDMSFDHTPVTAQIHIVDWSLDRSIHCRYGCATIPARTRKIFTCNKMPFTEEAAILRRIKLINMCRD